MEFKEIKKVLWRILILNWLVAFIRIFMGFSTGALSILLDGLHSLFDGFTNIIGIFGIKMAEKPADEIHPYGHQKYEAIASQIIFTFLVITVWKAGEGIVERFLHPVQPEISWMIVGVLVSSVFVDYFVARYENKKARELKSVILKIDATHTKCHYVTTGTVILGTLLIKLGLPAIIDPVISIFVVLFIIKLVYEVFTETSAILSDGAPIAVKRIENIIEKIEGTESSHQIRTRGDEKHVFLDFHLILSPNLSLERAHGICHRVKEKIQQEIPEIKDIIIHFEPKMDEGEKSGEKEDEIKCVCK